MTLEKTISNFVENQFPAFYQEEGPMFIAFVKAYYEWLESDGQTIYHARKLPEYIDIDKTPEDFIIHFKETYLKGIQFDTETNKRLLIKHILDLYRTKGTQRAIELLFKIVFGEEVQIYYPGDDLFKTSDGQWEVPQYLEVSNSPRNDEYLGKVITGVSSGSTAFVDRIIRRRINGKYADIFYITGISSDFITGERIKIDNDLSEIPVIIGSLSNLEVISGGADFNVGDIVTLTSNNGSYGTARVSEVQGVTGVVNFNLVDGGFGFSSNAEMIISSKVLSVANVRTDGTLTYSKFYPLLQPQANITIYDINGTFANGDIVENYYANGTVSGWGQVMDSTQLSVSNTGELFVSVVSGNLAYDSTIAKQGNAVTAFVNTYTDKTVSANIFIESTNNGVIVVNMLAGNFQLGETVVQFNANSTPISAGKVTRLVNDASFETATLSNILGLFIYGAPVFGATSGAYGIVADVSFVIGVKDVVGTFTNAEYNFISSNNGNMTATVKTISTGSGANLYLGGIQFPETVSLNTDRLNAKNTGLMPFMSIKLDGSNSNVSANGYGFSKSPSSNINSKMIESLTYQTKQIGVISSLTGINPGQGYNTDIFVDPYQMDVYPYYKRDYIINYSNSTTSFLVGEIVNQPIIYNDRITLTVNNAGNLTFGETVFQSNGTANVASGAIISLFITANNGYLILNNVQGSFVNTYQVRGTLSNSNAFVSSVNNTPYTGTAKGMVKEGSNPSTLYLKRLSLNDSFVAGANITGLSTGSVAYADIVQEDVNSGYIGDNAEITANVQSSSGTVKSLQVYTSGFGYVNSEIVSFFSQDMSRSGSVKTILGKQGVGQGAYKSSNGFLSADKYLQDGDYYQEYSYEIRSSLDFNKYSDMLTRALHVAGNKMFGRPVLSSQSNTVTTASSEIQIN